MVNHIVTKKESELNKLRKIMYLISIGLMLMTLGCGSAPTTTSTSISPKTETTAPKIFTIQDIAGENNLSIGELNKIYRLDPKFKYNNGSNIVINFQSVKAMKQFKDFKNIIIVENIIPLNQTCEMFDKTGFFVAYDENGKQESDLQVTAGRLDNDNTGIVVYNDNKDLTRYKFLSFGPLDGAKGQQILFPIQ